MQAVAQCFDAGIFAYFEGHPRALIRYVESSLSEMNYTGRDVALVLAHVQQLGDMIGVAPNIRTLRQIRLPVGFVYPLQVTNLMSMLDRARRLYPREK